MPEEKHGAMPPNQRVGMAAADIPTKVAITICLIIYAGQHET